MGDFCARGRGAGELRLDRGLVFDTAQLAVQYALSGDGLCALVDPVLFQEEIAAGRLVQPFDLQVDDGYGYYLSIHPDDLDRPEISLFRTWLIRRFSRPFPPQAPAARADDPLRRRIAAFHAFDRRLLIAVFGVLAGNGVLTVLLPVRAQLEGFPALDIGLMGSAYFSACWPAPR